MLNLKITDITSDFCNSTGIFDKKNKPQYIVLDIPNNEKRAFKYAYEVCDYLEAENLYWPYDGIYAKIKITLDGEDVTNRFAKMLYFGEVQK